MAHDTRVARARLPSPSPPPKGRPLTRLNLAYPPETRERLHRLKEVTGAATITDVIADAIRAFEFIVEQREKGREIFVRGENEPLTMVKFFF